MIWSRCGPVPITEIRQPDSSSRRLQVVAIVAVNACGNVCDPKSGKALAGVCKDGIILDPLALFEQMADEVRELPQGNTTIGCIITNAKLDKSQCNKLASIAHNGYALTIRPVHKIGRASCRERV